MPLERRARLALGHVHRWAGLVLGLPLVLIGLTGSLLVFYPEIDQVLNPGLRVERPLDVSSIRWRDVAARLDVLSPGSGWRIEVPSHANRPVMARQMRTLPDGRFSPRVVTLDARTLEVTSDRLWGDYVVTWVYDLHYTLLAGPTGRLVIGWIGMSALLLLASGVVLGWPTFRRWRATLRPRIRRGRVLACYDIHTKAGFYGLAVLPALVLTGAVLALPQVVNPLLAWAAPVWSPPVLNGTLEPGVPPVDADAAVRLAREAIPGAEVRWIDTPVGPTGVYRIRMWSDGEPSRRFPASFVWIDPGTGQVLATRKPEQQSLSDVFLAWQHPLHNGEAFGLTGRLMVLCCGLVPIVMAITGYLRWMDKRRARRRSTRGDSRSTPTATTTKAAAERVR